MSTIPSPGHIKSKQPGRDSVTKSPLHKLVPDDFLVRILTPDVYEAVHTLPQYCFAIFGDAGGIRTRE